MVCTRSSAKRRESGKVDNRQEGLSGGEPATPTQQVPQESLPHQPPGGPSPSGPLPSKDNLSASATDDPQDLAIPGEANPINAILQHVICELCLRKGRQMQIPSEEPIFDEMAQNVEEFALAVLDRGDYGTLSVDEPYEGISKTIQYIAVNAFTTTWEQLTPEEQKKLKSWAPNAEHLIKSDRGRQALFTAWLWHILDDNIFSAEPSKKWQGMEDKMAIWNLLGQSMSILQDLDTREYDGWPVKYQLWRSLFAQLARESTKTIRFGSLPKGHVQKVVTAELGHLMKWHTAKSYTEDDWAFLEGDVAWLDLIFMCSRAKLRLRWGPPIGFPFNGSIADDGLTLHMTRFDVVEYGYWRDAEYEGRPVEVVMVPTIEVLGGCFGFEFDVACRQHDWRFPIVVAVEPPPEDAGERSAGAEEPSGIADEAA